jgi:hypothetical protein
MDVVQAVIEQITPGPALPDSMGTSAGFVLQRTRRSPSDTKYPKVPPHPYRQHRGTNAMTCGSIGSPTVVMCLK